MPRLLRLLPLAGVLLLAGCRLFDDRPVLFPRLHDDAHFSDRFHERYAPASAPTPYPLPSSGGCLPCASGGGYSYTTGGYVSGQPLSGGLMSGPVIPGGGSALPAGYPVPPAGPSYPVYPGGDGVPVRPRPDNELPLPGEYSKPFGEVSRPLAPKPPAALK